jgi:hypothetical protein
MAIRRDAPLSSSVTKCKPSRQPVRLCQQDRGSVVILRNMQNLRTTRRQISKYNKEPSRNIHTRKLSLERNQQLCTSTSVSPANYRSINARGLRQLTHLRPWDSSINRCTGVGAIDAFAPIVPWDSSLNQCTGVGAIDTSETIVPWDSSLHQCMKTGASDAFEATVPWDSSLNQYTGAGTIDASGTYHGTHRSVSVRRLVQLTHLRPQYHGTRRSISVWGLVQLTHPRP